MIAPADRKAGNAVVEMISLGAVFEASCIDGRAVWSWQPQPEVMRNAIRRYWNSLTERPDDQAMVGAILRAARQEALS